MADEHSDASFNVRTIADAAANFFKNNDDDDSIEQLLLRSMQSVNRNTETTAKLLEEFLNKSQSDASDAKNSSKNKSWASKFDSEQDTKRRSSKWEKDGFLDAFEKGLKDSVLGSDFEKRIKSSLDEVADHLGVNIKGIPGELGHKLGEQAMAAFKKTDFGSQLTSEITRNANQLFDVAKDKAASLLDISDNGFSDEIVGKFNSMTDGISNVFNNIKKPFSAAASESGKLKKAFAFTKKSVAGMGKGLSHLSLKSFGSALKGGATAIKSVGTQALSAAKGFAAANPATIAFGAAVVVGMKALESAQMALEAFSKMIEAVGKAANRTSESRQKALDEAQKRLTADINTMVQKPFEILTAAAEAWYNTWDSNLRLINGTQGYTKADLQDLMGWYTERLRSEGLSKYVSASDITNNLATVLNAGLSGSIAEEFAYQATRLNAIIPTEDFFSYAGTYASVAANAVRAGKSQQEAIEAASNSLNTFAAGLVYANRELTGGFTTGLKDASSIYTQAVNASLAGRYSDASGIAAVMLAVRSEIGAIAPDLASSLTDTIYSMLTGGNNSGLVALRSLSGLNASNTEFLRAVQTNPSGIFATIFSNLGKMYGQSSDAYMEKAEGYAELFGLSSETFQRVDFNALANSISRMSMSGELIQENIDLLKAGETTTTAEQLKNQQINEYMINEGLAYVLDNEAARAIQQHMWDEQLALEMQEATYSVDLTGSAAQFIEDISNAINNLLNLINPFAWANGVADVIQTVHEANANELQIESLLQAGKVGQGQYTDFRNLTTRGKDLNLTQDLVQMMGGFSHWNNAVTGVLGVMKTGLEILSNPGRLLSGGLVLDGLGELSTFVHHQFYTGLDYMPNLIREASSGYTWGSLGSKSAAKLNQALLGASTPNLATAAIYSPSAQVKSSSAAAASAAIEKMLADDYLVEQFVKQGKTYEDWAASASQFNITDIDTALSEAGYSSSDIQKYFGDKQTEQGQQMLAQTAEEEKIFRDTGIAFWNEQFPLEYRDPLLSKVDLINEQLASVIENQITWKDYFDSEWINKGWDAYVSMGTSGNGLFNKFYNEFMKYFVNHYYYSNTQGYKYSDVEEIQNKSKAQERGDTVYALAEMLTKNVMDLQDPQMQANALLGQILVVATAIMEQNNKVATTTGAGELMNTLSGLSLGVTQSV